MTGPMRRLPSFVGLSLFGLALTACPAPAPLCTPGTSVACVGAGGCAGGQVCNAAGTGYGACDCGGTDAGLPDGGMPIDGGLPVDGGELTDVPADAPPGACNPIVQTGCGPGERCTWIVVEETPTYIGTTGCVPDGTVAVGGACVSGPPGDTTGFDDCAAGLYCMMGECREICGFAPDTCDGESCTRFVGVFATGDDDPIAGVCQPTCDPLTQLRGDGTPCPTGQSCYGLFGGGGGGVTFTCAGTGTTAIGATIPGTTFANSCVARGIPAMRADGTRYCTSWCTPVETHSGAPAGAGGASPDTCAAAGVAAEECLFAWLRSSSTVVDPRLNDLGICFDRAGVLIDVDMDGTPETPYPSCTTLPNTDGDGDGVPEHREHGCAPLPEP